MFMPGLRPDALGLNVHLDFARHVEALGPRFQVLTTEEGPGQNWPGQNWPGDETLGFVISMGHSPGSLWERCRLRFSAPTAYRLPPPRSPGIFVRRVPRSTCCTWRLPTRMVRRPLWPAG